MARPEQLRLAFDDWRLTPLGQRLAPQGRTLGLWRDVREDPIRIEEIRLVCDHPVRAMLWHADGTWTCEDCEDERKEHADAMP